MTISRPADDRCFETLLDVWRNTPTAALLGAKQLDWQAKNLHNVGLYAGHHDVVSLVVDGEPDEEQYDGRQDGAVGLPIGRVGAVVGDVACVRRRLTPGSAPSRNPTDLCRRICLGGGRVVVVPQARIAPQRQPDSKESVPRYGRPVEDEDGRIDPDLAVRAGECQIRVDWTCTVRVVAVALAVVHHPVVWDWPCFCLARKQPYHACCELAMPWRALLRLRGAWRARARLRRQSKVTLKSLSTLSANHRQVREWLDRRRALRDQRDVVLLSPLEKDHLRKRLLRRWGLAFGAALIAGIWIVVLYWDVLRSVCSGASMYSAQLLPTGASFTQLLHTATTFMVVCLRHGHQCA